MKSKKSPPPKNRCPISKNCLGCYDCIPKSPHMVSGAGLEAVSPFDKDELRVAIENRMEIR